ncbi:hypothetical protein TNCT_556951 [Trichonephila clavata]|uniref:Uncharacterized protein n=1 Tax=Trichonephila clavata TaxID=2740835 RepID=A0A8X6H2T7_TRICU|nr:hypothetical protein TNCT_556951 [Trichonephila clavata]
MVALLNQQLCDNSSFHKTTRYRDRTTRTPFNEETMIFVEQVLSELLDKAHVWTVKRSSLWYPHDGSPTRVCLSLSVHNPFECNIWLTIDQPWSSSALTYPIINPDVDRLTSRGK